MENHSSKVDVYNEGYVSLNHAYVQIYKFYTKLLESDDIDEEVSNVLREILLVFNPTLDRIKSEMTVKTRYKEENASPAKKESSSKNKKTDQVILHGNFTGD